MVCWIINQSTGIYRSEPPCEGSLHQAFRCCCHRSSRGRNVIGRKLAAKHGDGLCAFREDCALHRELPLWRGIPVSNYLAFYFSCLCRNFVLRLLGKVGVNSRPCATYPHPPLLSPIARWIPDEFGQKKRKEEYGRRQQHLWNRPRAVLLYMKNGRQHRSFSGKIWMVFGSPLRYNSLASLWVVSLPDARRI